MKNNKALLVVLVILLAVAGYYFMNKDASTLKSRDGVFSDFAVEDTAAIDKIFIADSGGESVTLIKGDGEWLVNGKHKARPESIAVLMKTFDRVAVKSPVSSAAFDNVVTSIATKSVKVEIYQGEDEPSKVYYVGESTQNNQGTFMLLEKDGVKSTEPFVMYIPGFYGYLTTRFYADPLEWRDAAIFKYSPNEINEVKVNFYVKLEESFTIKQSGTSLELYDNQTAKLVENTDKKMIEAYLSFFEKAYYENVVVGMGQAYQDSITATQPYFSIEVTDIFGKKNKIVSYYRPNYKELKDVKGNPYPYDVDRMFGYLNDELLIFIQYRTFDKFLVPKQTFIVK